ncbi:bifunctional glycosyltransferase/CDP-glycerol:glycerophosphate glycerophosphotransferase [Streptacidiphilus fuscans]|uniref:Bifunctional glycosyltransferase family 2 protein/CDP-glycerol:glycerophosphate glycerophosphotransferase n=1 Tax=Streptacidiphilus fuscans TaxID=2789292 RepID=A0A931FIV0_9ACTN|nr:bifunctional glycosyltransferase family 2 protein/CDP-glycerol:glycerophosphate glycerophosphotransferase [Streptacidiphilus fuscans]MBF9072139.1 bifunctional glycosyltransferase family 2 protein/CDP-glycerol:glycerophosphate glycerophosphotransferase [Streptacidiphilus fuscans]MBF9072950.1 bifunctional glycosyltransferase family 2 protein/CDP-glycerol:glycerophosphate glycerophosphotransferase [Streptacidiphilus fuscans]
MSTGVSLSIVLPVYGVADYLPRCLDSLLSADLPSLQVIAVDDCSPDRSGAILDAYAERDSRLTVRHLAVNRGLGGAREVGLKYATGDYVWFVDSDDWLADGAVDLVAARLAEIRPDVLITGFARTFPDGTTEPDTWRRLLVEPPLPEVFTLADRPGLLQMIMSVWNKVIRREYLASLEVQFGGGYYEDISVTYPLLLGAQKLSYLDKDLYFYRRQRAGAITNTASPKHADAFPQYEAIFTFMERHPEIPAELRRAVFDRTVKQAVTVLDTPGLVPERLREEFFRRTVAHFHRRRPAGYAYPKGLRGVQYRLVDRGAWGAYQRLRPLRALPRTLPNTLKRAVRGAGRRGLYETYRRLPLNENLAVFAAYWYRGYACNPAAIYEAMRELAPQVKGVWVVETAAQAKGLPEGVPYVVANTPRYFKLMATAKYLVNNVNFPHTMTKRSGSVHVQTQHGTPLKYLGLDLKSRPLAAGDMDWDRLLEHVARWDYLVSPSPFATDAFGRAYPGPYEVLETGYPRNDRLANADAAEIAAVREKLGIPADQRVVLYTPTHREQQDTFVPALDIVTLARSLGPRTTLLMRAHYFYDDAGLRPDDVGVVDVSAYPVVEDLYLAADILVTDYSSTMFDYAVLDRPIVVFAPDWDEYQRVRGTYFDLMAEPPGAVASTPEELAELLRVGGGADTWETEKLRGAFRAKFCALEDGGAAERVVRRVFPVQ